LHKNPKSQVGEVPQVYGGNDLWSR